MNRFFRRLRRFLLVLLALGLLLMLPAWLRLRGLIRPLAEERARFLAESILTEAAAACAREGLFSYDALMHLRYSEGGELLSLSPDSTMLNLLCSEFMKQVNALWHDSAYTQSSFPLGAVLGSDLFASWGPNIPLRLHQSHSLRAQAAHSWEEAGINQSLHSLSLQVEGEVQVLLSGQSLRFSISRQVPVCQTLLMGKVPDWCLT